MGKYTAGPESTSAGNEEKEVPAEKLNRNGQNGSKRSDTFRIRAEAKAQAIQWSLLGRLEGD